MFLEGISTNFIEKLFLNTLRSLRMQVKLRELKSKREIRLSNRMNCKRDSMLGWSNTKSQGRIRITSLNNRLSLKDNN